MVDGKSTIIQQGDQMKTYTSNDETFPPSPLRLAKCQQQGLDPEHEIGRCFFEESDHPKEKQLKMVLSGSSQENSGSGRWLPKCGLQTCSIGITWEPTKDANSHTLLQTYRIRTTGVGP